MCLGCAASANASVVVGPTPLSGPLGAGCGGPCEVFNTVGGVRPNPLGAPFNGVLTRWRTIASGQSVLVTLRIVRPVPGNQMFHGVRSGSSASAPAGALAPLAADTRTSVSEGD